MTFIPSDNVLVFSTTAAALTAEARASFAKYPPKTVKFYCTTAKLFQEATFFHHHYYLPTVNIKCLFGHGVLGRIVQ
jgi:hypothetical protein